MAVDIYVKINGIPGESTDSKHKGWLEALSVSKSVDQPVSQASASGGRTGGRADFSQIMCTSTVDKAYPLLMLHAANGNHISEILVEFCEQVKDKHTFMKWTLTDVIVSHVGLSAAGGDAKPIADYSFAYGKLKEEYTEVDHMGKPGATTEATWNLEENKQE